MVINSPCLTDSKNWLFQYKRHLLASPKQMALGKDISNPLIVDSLLKTIWLSMHHVIAIKHWLFQSKRLLMQRLPSLMRLQMMLETRTTRFQTTIRSEEVFGYILLVIKKLTLKKLDD
ncbi:hypothetical protein Tco_1178539 [Tanacetum coccineum]